MEDIRTFKKMAIALSKNQLQDKEEFAKFKDINTLSKKAQPNSNAIGPTKIVNLNPIINGVTKKWQLSEVLYSTDPAVQAYAPKLNSWVELQNKDKPAYFSKYNIKLAFPKYTKDEYEAFVRKTDPSWSKEETDYLIQLLEAYEGNFIIMADRWDSRRFPSRSIEDLKERTFQVLKGLVEGNNLKEFQAFRVFNYDKQAEIFRKLKTEKFSARTENVHRQEEQLLNEIKNLELLIRKKEKENKEFQKLIEFSKEEKMEIGEGLTGLDEIVKLEKGLSTSLPFAYNRGGLMHGPIPNLPPLTNKKIELAMTQLEIPENLFATETNIKMIEHLKMSLVKLFALNILQTQKQEELNALKETHNISITEGTAKGEKTRTIDKPAIVTTKKIKEE